MKCLHCFFLILEATFVFLWFLFFCFPFFLLSSFLFSLFEKGKNRKLECMANVSGPPFPGPLDSTKIQVTTWARKLDPFLSSSGSSITTLEPLEQNQSRIEAASGNDSYEKEGSWNTIYVEEIPLENNYDIIAEIFSEFGQIKELQVRLSWKQVWEAWIK